MAAVEPIAPDPAPAPSRGTLVAVGLFLAALAVGLIFFVPDAEPKIAADVTDPVKLYQESCLICHGAGGEGKGAFPKVKGTALGESEIAALIENGKGNMPGFRSMTPEQRAALAKYVKGMK